MAQDRILLDALQQQATVGQCNRPRPGMWETAEEKAKYEAWKKLGGMPRAEAMHLYVQARRHRGETPGLEHRRGTQTVPAQLWPSHMPVRRRSRLTYLPTYLLTYLLTDLLAYFLTSLLTASQAIEVFDERWLEWKGLAAAVAAAVGAVTPVASNGGRVLDVAATLGSMRAVRHRAAHGALPRRAPCTRRTADLVHHRVWWQARESLDLPSTFLVPSEYLPSTFHVWWPGA